MRPPCTIQWEVSELTASLWSTTSTTGLHSPLIKMVFLLQRFKTFSTEPDNMLQYLGILPWRNIITGALISHSTFFICHRFQTRMGVVWQKSGSKGKNKCGWKAKLQKYFTKSQTGIALMAEHYQWSLDLRSSLCAGGKHLLGSSERELSNDLLIVQSTLSFKNR